jgi:hypothetical protein
MDSPDLTLLRWLAHGVADLLWPRRCLRGEQLVSQVRNRIWPVGRDGIAGMDQPPEPSGC